MFNIDLAKSYAYSNEFFAWREFVGILIGNTSSNYLIHYVIKTIRFRIGENTFSVVMAS